MAIPDPQHLLARAESFFARGSLRKALACYGLIPADARVERQAADRQEARLLNYLGAFDLAEQAYKRALNYGPGGDRVEIEIEMAHFYKRRGQPEDAVRIYRALVSRTPQPFNLGDILYWLAELLNDFGNAADLDEGLGYLQRATTEHRALVLDWEVHNTRGYALTKKGAVEEAIGEFQRALENGYEFIDVPGNVFNNMATCLAQRGQPVEAIDWFGRAISSQRSQTDTRGYAHYGIGALLAYSRPKEAMKELKSAQREFEKAIRNRDVSERYGKQYTEAIKGLLKNVERGLSLADAKSMQLISAGGVTVPVVVILESTNVTNIHVENRGPVGVQPVGAGATATTGDVVQRVSYESNKALIECFERLLEYVGERDRATVASLTEALTALKNKASSAPEIAKAWSRAKGWFMSALATGTWVASRAEEVKALLDRIHKLLGGA